MDIVSPSPTAFYCLCSLLPLFMSKNLVLHDWTHLSHTENLVVSLSTAYYLITLSTPAAVTAIIINRTKIVINSRIANFFHKYFIFF